MIKEYSSDYDWILWIDHDTLFLNCNLKIEQSIINHSYLVHEVIENNSISLIFRGEYCATINSRVFVMKNNNWSDQVLQNWIYFEKNVEKYD